MECARSAPRGARRDWKREVSDGHWLSVALACPFPQQTACAGFLGPNALREKFYWRTDTLICATSSTGRSGPLCPGALAVAFCTPPSGCPERGEKEPRLDRRALACPFTECGPVTPHFAKGSRRSRWALSVRRLDEAIRCVGDSGLARGILVRRRRRLCGAGCFAPHLLPSSLSHMLFFLFAPFQCAEKQTC